MKNPILILLLTFSCITIARSQENTLIKPHKEQIQEAENKEPKSTNFVFNIESYVGFGKEKLGHNYKKKQNFLGLKLNFSFADVEKIYGFLSLVHTREKGVDFTPVGQPYTWDEKVLEIEAGFGFRVTIPLVKEKFGSKIKLESNLAKLFSDEYPVPTFSLGIFVQKGSFYIIGGNTFDITRNSAFLPYIAVEYEFKK